MTALCRLLLLVSAITLPSTLGNERDSEPQRFSCPKAGFFPVPGSCQEYYECFVWKGLLYLQPSMCSPGMIFDKVSSTCRPESLTNPSVCAGNSDEVTTTVVPQEEALSNDNNTPITLDKVPSEDVNTTDEVDFSKAGNSTENVSAINEDSLDDVEGHNITSSNGEALNTEDLLDAEGRNVTLTNGTITDVTTTTTQAPIEVTLCDHLNFVTTYSTLLIGTPFQRPSLDYEKEFNKLSQRYNNILEKAQNNSLIWKNGDSIFTGIQKTLKLASQYEREFNRKYEICQQQITKQTSSEEIIAKLREDIRKLQEDIEGNEQALAVTTVPQVRKYFENNINSKRQEINRKQEEIASSSKAALQLGELLQFLEYVKADANDVENLARHLKTRINMFKRDYASDLSTLQRFMNRVNESIHSLSDEAESHKVQSGDNIDRQQDIELRKVNLNEETTSLNTAQRENNEAIKKLERKMEKKRQTFYKKMKTVCDPEGPMKLKLPLKPTRKEKEEACNELLEIHNVRLDLSNELDQTENLLQENERKRNRITLIIAEIDKANQDLTQLLGDAPLHRARLQEIQAEVANLKLLHNDLLDLTTNANDAIDSLTVIEITIDEVRDSFETLTKQYAIMITGGQSAKTDEAKLQEKAATEQHISTLASMIQQQELPDIEKCT